MGKNNKEFVAIIEIKNRNNIEKLRKTHKIIEIEDSTFVLLCKEEYKLLIGAFSVLETELEKGLGG